MLFTLEILKAKHGDCLIVHCGTSKNPNIMVIDGGPAGVYNATLKPRLQQISENLQKETLPLSMVMVSHIDDDHINGIKALTDFMLDEKAAHKPAPYDIANFWCNNFDDIIGNVQLPKIAGIAAGASIASVSAAALPQLKPKESHVSAVIASVDQGRKVQKNAVALGLAINKPFKPMKKTQAVMVRGDIGQKPISLAGTKITVLHPNSQRLEELQAEWDKQLKKAAEKGDKTVVMATVAQLLVKPDTSPYNLSSIVCLVEANGKKILLTGDARMDDIEDALTKQKLFKSGKLSVDIFKLPHHGSDRNATPSLLKKISAKHYIISADGKHSNPDKGLLDMLAANVKTGTIYFTYSEGENELAKKLAAFKKKLKKEGSKLKLVFRNETEPSITINLGDALNY